MIERAEWRPRPGDPRSPLGVYFGRDRLLGLPIGLWIAGYVVAVLFAMRFTQHSIDLEIFVVALMPLAIRRKEYRVPRAPDSFRGFREASIPKPHEAFSADRMDSVADLVPLPAPDAFYGVEMTLRQGERVMGGDLGVVAFSEGWLVYEGLGTAFSLAPSDVRDRWVEGETWTLSLPEKQSLTMRSYDAGWGKAIRAWIALPSPVGHSRLPPLARSPFRRLRAAGYLHFGAAILGGMSLASFAARSGLWGVLAFGALASILYLCGMFAAARGQRLALRMRRGGDH